MVSCAATGVASGETRIALVVGGEAQASIGVLAKAGVNPVTDCGWSARVAVSHPGLPVVREPAAL